jgi:hypothetical protein
MLRAEYTTQFKKNLKLARLRCHDLGAESKAPAWIVPNVLHRAPHTGGVTPPAKVTSNRVGRDLRARRIRAVTPPAKVTSNRVERDLRTRRIRAVTPPASAR